MMRTGFIIGSTLLILTLQAGCSSFKKTNQESILKPISGQPGTRFSGGKSDERELCIETAKAVAQEGHISEAVQLYEKAEELGSDRQRLDLELAPLYAQNRETNQAVARYQRVVADGKADAEVYNNLAWTLIESKRYVEARSTIESSLEKFPSHERLRATQACLLYKMEDEEGAFQEFASIYGDAAAHHNLAILNVEDGKFSEGLAHLEYAAASPNASEESVALFRTLQNQMKTAGDTNSETNLR